MVASAEALIFSGPRAPRTERDLHSDGQMVVASPRHIRSTGNGMKPMCSLAQDGRWIVAPLWPQAVQRAQRRSLSLDT